MSLAKFQNQFEPQINQYERCVGDCFSTVGTDVPEYRLIAEMLEWVFGFTPEQITKTVMGKTFQYEHQGEQSSYRLGGIDGLYRGSAVWTTYEAICFYLKSGWWPMGLDKAHIVVPSTETFIQPKPDQSKYSREYKVHYHETPNDAMVVACTDENGPNWYYSAILIRPELIMDFIDAFDDGMNFQGIEFNFDNGNFIGSGYSAADVDELWWHLSMR